jgi:hypothetical protein
MFDSGNDKRKVNFSFQPGRFLRHWKKVLISEGTKRNFLQAVVFEHVVKAGGTHGGSHQDARRLY